MLGCFALLIYFSIQANQHDKYNANSSRDFKTFKYYFIFPKMLVLYIISWLTHCCAVQILLQLTISVIFPIVNFLFKQFQPYLPILCSIQPISLATQGTVLCFLLLSAHFHHSYFVGQFCNLWTYTPPLVHAKPSLLFNCPICTMCLKCIILLEIYCLSEFCGVSDRSMMVYYVLYCNGTFVSLCWCSWVCTLNRGFTLPANTMQFSKVYLTGTHDVAYISGWRGLWVCGIELMPLNDYWLVLEYTVRIYFEYPRAIKTCLLIFLSIYRCCLSRVLHRVHPFIIML